MAVIVREYKQADIEKMVEIWNEVVEEGIAFPQEGYLTEEEGKQFFADQTYTGVAELAGEVVGLYILHPNNVGRCGHIANTSYAVKSGLRGKKIGEKLVLDSIKMSGEKGFKLLQFNAVVASNKGAIHLYKKLGFTPLGEIPGGFRMKDGTYEAIIPFYIETVSE